LNRRSALSRQADVAQPRVERRHQALVIEPADRCDARAGDAERAREPLLGIDVSTGPTVDA